MPLQIGFYHDSRFSRRDFHEPMFSGVAVVAITQKYSEPFDVTFVHPALDGRGHLGFILDAPGLVAS